jgi:urease accessory protein
MRSSPPITLRRTGPGTIHMVSSAAWPVGGDHHRLDVVVDDDSSLVIRSVAASMAHPGPHGASSEMALNVEVRAGAMLTWSPEPTVLIAGCDHRATVSIRLAGSARLIWRDEVQLGRWGEMPGSLLQRLSIDRDGCALLRTALGVGPMWPQWTSQAVLGTDTVALGTAVVVGSPAPEPAAGRSAGLAWVACPIDVDATTWTVLGPSMAEVRAMLTALLSDLPTLTMGG